MVMPHIAAIGTAVPDYTLTPAAVKDFAAGLFHAAFRDIDRLLKVFDNTHITCRYIARPLEWYHTPRTFPETNALYQETALALSRQAAEQAITRANLSPADIGALIFVSNTGLATPSLDVPLVQDLGLPAHTIRLPLWGLGCSGGVSSLSRAAELMPGLNGRAVLLIAVEICSATFQHSDRSKANLIALSLFADGAAAVVLHPDGTGPEILANHSILIPDTSHFMGWDMVPSGFKLRFSRHIPALVRNHMQAYLHQACQHWHLDPAAIKHYVVHPGGTRVIEAYAENFKLPVDYFQSAQHVITHYGNMSSPTVLFVLQQFLAHTPPSGDYGVMLALGPGFSVEHVLFRW